MVMFFAFVKKNNVTRAQGLSAGRAEINVLSFQPLGHLRIEDTKTWVER